MKTTVLGDGASVLPNPGSDEAIAGKCTCPVIDNHHGRGMGLKNPDGSPMFWIAVGCPMHDHSSRPRLPTYPADEYEGHR